jgi:hypothetical protein
VVADDLIDQPGDMKATMCDLERIHDQPDDGVGLSRSSVVVGVDYDQLEAAAGVGCTDGVSIEDGGGGSMREQEAPTELSIRFYEVLSGAAIVDKHRHTEAAGSRAFEDHCAEGTVLVQ